MNEDRPPVEEDRPATDAEPRPPEAATQEERESVVEDRERIEEPGPSRPLPLGRAILGLVLVGIGVVWLLQALDVVSFSFLAILPAALIVVGVALIGAARTGRHSPLIVLGIVLTVILTIASGFDIRLQGGVGDRTVRPATVEELEREYSLSIGQLTIDLRGVSFPPGRTFDLKATAGLGQLTVRLPDDPLLAISARAHAGAGQLTLGNREESGLDVELSNGGFGQITGDQPRLTLDLSVGLGQIEVTR